MNLLIIDQENRRLVYTPDGKSMHDFDHTSFLFPEGGGWIIGDGNAWAERNILSASQFGWDEGEVARFVESAAQRGYRCRSVANKLARSVQFAANAPSEKALLALWDYSRELIARTGSFDSGRDPSKCTGKDNSFGQRSLVVRDFLRLQNDNGYLSPFGEAIVQIAFDTLDKEDRPLFDLRKTKPKVGEFRRLAAVAVCTHDPVTGLRRRYDDNLWGTNFIVRRIIGLNGQMRGKGERAPGNPMRAALRATGRRYGDKINKEERSRFDRCIREMIKALRQTDLPPAW